MLISTIEQQPHIPSIEIDMANIECCDFQFYNDFDSANLARVEATVPTPSVVQPNHTGRPTPPELPDIEFNLWTKPDCVGTEFENANRTWFYFGVKAPMANLVVKFNLVDLNRQAKMYSQGMAPVYRIIPGKPQWDRIRDKPTYTNDNDIFILSFKFKTPENTQNVLYFAFTYPYSYSDVEKSLGSHDERLLNVIPTCEDDIYYCRELVCNSLDGRRLDLITVSSYHGITSDREERLTNLFPNKNISRPYKFVDKKVIFISARVHPGETPSSFVFNGFLKMLLTRDDPIAIALRRIYVFKLIPCLNPDGVAKGHYRTDTRGVNLNRMYLCPTVEKHPSIYAARSLIKYYHFGVEVDDKDLQNDNVSDQVSNLTLQDSSSTVVNDDNDNVVAKNTTAPQNDNESKNFVCNSNSKNMLYYESGLFLYIDMHGHASKKGIFMYGNHFANLDDNVECMLLPKIMSINNQNFHFTSCNFTEKNMYLKDKRDGMSREGSGRVAVLKLTGLIRSYTLECNYNTGRIVNVLPNTVKEGHNKPYNLSIPPKYTPAIFEEVGRSFGPSILDLTGDNPHTRIPNSEFHSLNGLKDWLRYNCVEFGELGPVISKKKGVRPKDNTPQEKYRKKTTLKHSPKKFTRARPSVVPVERKENYKNATTSSHTNLPEIVRHLKAPARHNKTTTSAPTTTKSIKQRRDTSLKVKNSGGEKAALGVARARSRPSHATSLHRLRSGPDTNDWNVATLRGGLQLFRKGNECDGGDTHLDVASHSRKNEPGTSKQTMYRSHNFSKSSSFSKSKMKMHNLRRLTNVIESPCKVDKIKRRKKLKSK